MSGTPIKVIIVCPLRIEQRTLLAHGLGAMCDVRCSGPGETGMATIADVIGPNPRVPVLLAGVAGSLSRDFTVGIAAWIDRVVGSDGATAIPTFPQSHAGSTRAAVTSSTQLVCTDHQRSELRDRTKADLVDQESAPFAAVAQRLGWTWGIIRGISDVPGSPASLPPQAARWISGDGRTRLLPVLAWLAQHPRDLPRLAAIRRNTAASLAAVAACIRETLHALK